MPPTGISGSGKCTCRSGYGGPDCRYSSEERCNGHGVIKEDGNCNCDPGYAEPLCDKCVPNFYGPSCSKGKSFCYSEVVFVSASFSQIQNVLLETHAMDMEIVTSPEIVCVKKAWIRLQGAPLAFHSIPRTQIAYVRIYCVRAYYNMFDLHIDCEIGVNCIHGKCSNQGKCECDPGFQGDKCDECAAGYVGSSSCIPCPGLHEHTWCSGHGNCVASGNTSSCICADGFAGYACECRLLFFF